MREGIRFAINIILLGIISVSATSIGIKGWQYYKADRTYSKVEEFKPAAENTAVATSVDTDTQDNYKKLKEINSDYKLWISIPEFGIDYPVVQGDDNEFYLHHDFYKNKSSSGTIFVDYRNDVESDKNLMLYGHNMKNGSMFNKITKYKDADEFKKGKIKIIENNMEYTYEVFSVFVENENSHALKNEFNSTAEYDEYIDKIKEKSKFKKEVKNTDYENIITLYTCSYEYDGSRTIVVATLVNE